MSNDGERVSRLAAAHEQHYHCVACRECVDDVDVQSGMCAWCWHDSAEDVGLRSFHSLEMQLRPPKVRERKERP